MGEFGDILALLASAAIQNRAQRQAADNTRAAALAAQQRQLQAQDEATAAAMRRAAQFEPMTRQQAQNEVQQQLTQQYDQRAQAPMVTPQGVSIGTTLPEGQGGTQYLATKAREQQKALASSRALAQLMGQIGSASELRKNEAIGMGDTAGEIGRIQTGANNRANIDQFAIENAGQVGVGPMLASAALRGIGMSGIARSGLKPNAASTSWLG